MRLPLYHYHNKKVVIWGLVRFESLQNIKHVEVEYSRLKDSGILGVRNTRAVLESEFTEHFELQPEQVEIGWSRIVPKEQA